MVTTVSPPRILCSASGASDHQAVYDVKVEHINLKGELRIEIKLARMSFNVYFNRWMIRMSFNVYFNRWMIQFQCVKKVHFDNVMLVFEGFNGLHAVVWDGETGYGTPGAKHDTNGGIIVVCGEVGMTDPREAEKFLLKKLTSEFGKTLDTLLHPEATSATVATTALYTDEKYKDSFGHASSSTDMYTGVPMTSLGAEPRGKGIEYLLTTILQTHFGCTIDTPEPGSIHTGKRKRGANTSECDFLVDTLRAESKSSLVTNVPPCGNNKTGHEQLQWQKVKRALHDVRFFSWTSHRAIHFWFYGKTLPNNKDECTAFETSSAECTTLDEVEHSLQTKLAHDPSNVYFACIEFEDGDGAAFDARCQAMGKALLQPPAPRPTPAPATTTPTAVSPKFNAGASQYDAYPSQYDDDGWVPPAYY